MLTTLLHLFAALIGIVALLIGLGAVIAPRRASAGYGIAVQGEAIPYVRATGVRDVFVGLTFLVLAYFDAWRAVGYLSLAGALVACVDGWMVKAHGRSPFWLVHGAGALIFIVYAAVLLGMSS